MLSFTFCLARKKNIVTIFSHGIADTWKQVHGYAKSYQKHDCIYHNDRYLIHTPFVSFNYPDATTKFYRVNYNETSFGQENEIGRFHKAYRTTLERYNKHGVILWGLSRGASNVLIFTGLHQPTNVKALILESPYYTMADVIENIMIKTHINWLPLSYGETVTEFIFKKYTRYGHSPANCIEHISKNIPIFIICSKKDHLVPYSSSMNIYKKLVESGHQHAYIFITDNGKHAAILQGPDGEKYQWILNAFYKKYKLPHCAISAAKGEPLLALCQPKIN
jgi:pimeloyl-ACP methyl ester carboxylesterase